MFKRPKNDDERMQNLIEALSEPAEGGDALDELIQEELARRGHTIESWAAEYEARYQEAVARAARERRARRNRRIKVGAAVVVGLGAAAAGGALALEETRGLTGGVDVQQSMDPTPPPVQSDTSGGAKRRR